MPTYEYECLKCGKVFEVFQSITDSPLKQCKYCQGSVRRLIGTGGGFIFKGKGFYATDYASRDYKERQRKDVPPSCPAAGGADCSNCPNTDK